MLGFPLEFGLGFALSGPEQHFGPNPAAFGHDGFGGSAACADPEAGLAIAYVMNRMGMNLADDPRKMAVIEAVYRSVTLRRTLVMPPDALQPAVIPFLVPAARRVPYAGGQSWAGGPLRAW